MQNRNRCTDKTKVVTKRGREEGRDKLRVWD